MDDLHIDVRERWPDNFAAQLDGAHREQDRRRARQSTSRAHVVAGEPGRAVGIAGFSGPDPRGGCPAAPVVARTFHVPAHAPARVYVGGTVRAGRGDRCDRPGGVVEPRRPPRRARRRLDRGVLGRSGRGLPVVEGPARAHRAQRSARASRRDRLERGGSADAGRRLHPGPATLRGPRNRTAGARRRGRGRLGRGRLAGPLDRGTARRGGRQRCVDPPRPAAVAR